MDKWAKPSPGNSALLWHSFFTDFIFAFRRTRIKSFSDRLNILTCLPLEPKSHNTFLHLAVFTSSLSFEETFT